MRQIGVEVDAVSRFEDQVLAIDLKLHPTADHVVVLLSGVPIEEDRRTLWLGMHGDHERIGPTAEKASRERLVFVGLRTLHGGTAAAMGDEVGAHLRLVAKHERDRLHAILPRNGVEHIDRNICRPTLQTQVFLRRKVANLSHLLDRDLQHVTQAA